MQPKILLVDDREDNILSMETILAPDGYHLLKAYSGREALKILLAEVDFALILMDVKMPILNGFETASLIYEREKLKPIPIIFITANNYGDENVFKGYQAGGIDYILKPINPEILRAKVSVFINLYKKNHLLVEQERKLLAINEILGEEISDRKASEEKIREQNARLKQKVDELEQANQRLRRLAFVSSHELQAPLYQISTFSEKLLAKHSQAPDDVDALNHIKGATHHLQTAFLDILAFTGVPLELSTFVESDLNALLQDLLADMDGEIRASGATVTVDPIPLLYVSRGLMRFLFQNLISNALSYRRKDAQLAIRIWAEVADGNPPMCKVFVKDNGVGLNPQHSGEIFQMFKKVNGDFEGVGIGLALCKRIMDQHNGSINVTSNVNEGSTFVLTMPMKR